MVRCACILHLRAIWGEIKRYRGQIRSTTQWTPLGSSESPIRQPPSQKSRGIFSILLGRTFLRPSFSGQSKQVLLGRSTLPVYGPFHQRLQLGPHSLRSCVCGRLHGRCSPRLTARGVFLIRSTWGVFEACGLKLDSSCRRGACTVSDDANWGSLATFGGPIAEFRSASCTQSYRQLGAAPGQGSRPRRLVVRWW